MWWFIKFLLGIFALIIIIGWMTTYFDNSKACDKQDGHYNLTSHGFKCSPRPDR